MLFRSDLTAVSSDATNEDLVSMGADCETLTNDVITLQGDPPVPIASVNTVYQAALTTLARAGTECSNAVTNLDPSEMEQFTTDLTTANSDLAQASAEITSLTGSS